MSEEEEQIYKLRKLLTSASIRSYPGGVMIEHHKKNNYDLYHLLKEIKPPFEVR